MKTVALIFLLLIAGCLTDDNKDSGYNVHGKIVYGDGSGCEGVTVELKGNNASKKAVTNGQGFYTLNGVPGGGYELSASKDRLVFSPELIELWVIENDVKVEDINVTSVEHKITGRIIDTEGNIVPYISVFFGVKNGSGIKEINTDFSGYYFFDVSFSGAFVIKVGHDVSYDFDIANSDKDVELEDLTVTIKKFRVSGYIRLSENNEDGNFQYLEGINLFIKGYKKGNSFNTATDINGFYLANLSYWAGIRYDVYSITPISNKYSFEPEMYSGVTGPSSAFDFIATSLP